LKTSGESQIKRRKKIDCLGLGIIPLDYLATIPHMPEPGGKVNADSLCVQGGGPIPNALVALSRLGKKTALIAGVADDLIGKVSIDEIRREKVDHRFVIMKDSRRTPSDSAYGFVEAGSGRRTIALCRKIRVRPRDLKTGSYPIPRIVHLDGRDLDACIKLARWGKKVGAMITFDVGSIRNDVSPIFPLVDHLIVSDAYALGFTGKQTVRQAILDLSRLCPGVIGVTEGTRGSTAYEDGRFYHQKAFRIEVADTTGAGDSFHAGYMYGLLEGFSMPGRLLYGAAVATLKCTKPGSRGGNPTLKQLKSFLRNLPETYD
jgi:sulfofructose kinase